MVVFCLEYDTRYANAVASHEEDALTLSFDGTSRMDSWEAVEIASPFKSKKIVDFMYYTPGAIIASQKAVDRLYPLIEPHVEVLPLQCEWGKYYIFNVLSVLDCINYSASDYIPFGDRKTATGAPKVLTITKYVFYKDIIRNIPIFKDINRPKMPIYVDGVFVEHVDKWGLKGLKFKSIWEG